MRMSSVLMSMSTSCGLRQHGDGRRRRMDAATGLGRRHALHAVHAGFEFQMREHALARDGRDDFLVAADLAFAGRGDFDLPAAPGGIALIHAEQVAGEQRRFVAAGAGADFEDGVLVVGLVLRQQQQLDVALQRCDALLQLRQLGLGQRPHLGIGRPVGEHRFEVGDFAFRPIAARGSWPPCPAARNIPRRASHRFPRAGPAAICASSMSKRLTSWSIRSRGRLIMMCT